ncbi:Cyclin-dependent kinase 10 [Linnemannia zychae]|nr:Cyclin-dependent kinase 10 [Linnemannia zychae]
MIPDAVGTNVASKNVPPAANRSGSATKEQPLSNTSTNNRTEDGGIDKEDRRNSVVNGFKGPQTIHADSIQASSNRNATITTKDFHNDSSETKERRGSTREEGRGVHHKETANAASSSTDSKSYQGHLPVPSGTGVAAASASTLSSHNHRGISSQQYNRQRPPVTGSEYTDHIERAEANAKRQRTEKEGTERSGGARDRTGRDRGGRDGPREKDDSNRPQDLKDKGRERGRARDDNQASNQGAHRQQPSNKGNQAKDHSNKGRDNRDKQAQPKDKQPPPGESAASAAGTLSKPDPNSLLSITGRMGHLTPQKSFFGTSRIVDDFEKLNKVGEGTYGVVYRARDKKTNEIVALKRIRMERENDGLPISSLREIKLLKTLRHDNIVLVRDVAVGNDLDQIFLVMEYCEQDMAALMDNVKKPYTPAEVKCLMYQLLKGIEYCHDHYVIHRDLKLSNLLLNSQGILKIADFGLARSFGLPSRPMTPKVVTLWYRAPELLFGDLNYTTAVDMWSAGCIFGELLKHAPLLPGKVEKQQVDLIIELLGTPHEKIWQGFNKLPMSSIKLPEQRFNNLKNKFPHITDATRSLLSGLLTYDPKKRLSVKQALAHPYFIESPPAKHPSLLPTHPEIRNIQSNRHEDNPKLKRQPPGDDTESIGNNRKRMRQRSKIHPSAYNLRDNASITASRLIPTTRHYAAFGENTNTRVSNNNDKSSNPDSPTDAHLYPYPDTDFLGFEKCKNPLQLEKSIASYLKSHPEPSDRALVAMLNACANLCRATTSSSHPKTAKYTRKQRQQQHTQPSMEKKDAMESAPSLAPNLLETIIKSSSFSSEQVFRIARSIYIELAARPYPVIGVLKDLPSRQRISSLEVTNAFLNVCAIAGHFGDAYSVLQDMIHSPQGDIKPDLATYRFVLQAAASAKRQQSPSIKSQDLNEDQHFVEDTSVDTRTQEVIEQAVEILSKKARTALWIKLALGGLVGATVSKFTVMAIMALPTSHPLEGTIGSASEEPVSFHTTGGIHPAEEIIMLLKSQEVATGIGLAAGMLTIGYFILGSTRRPMAAGNQQAATYGHKSTSAPAEEQGVKTYHGHLPDILPRAKPFGLYFPDLATTSKDEIREYLQKCMES